MVLLCRQESQTEARLRELAPMAKTERGLPSMKSALKGGEGIVGKWTIVLISCVIMLHVCDRGGGSKSQKNFADVIDGSPQRKARRHDSRNLAFAVNLIHICVCISFVHEEAKVDLHNGAKIL